MWSSLDSKVVYRGFFAWYNLLGSSFQKGEKMDNNTIASIVSASLFAIISLAFAIAYIKYQNMRTKFENLSTQKHTNMLVDLDLATSEQLVKELRKRPGNPYLMISKVENENHAGLNIEVHNIPSPQQCFSMLHSATGYLLNEMKNRGIMPSMPDLEDMEGENWKGE